MNLAESLFNHLFSLEIEYTLCTWTRRLRNSRARKAYGKLEADGILDQFVKENSSEVASEVSSTSKDCGKDSDEDYQPPLKKNY